MKLPAPSPSRSRRTFRIAILSATVVAGTFVMLSWLLHASSGHERRALSEGEHAAQADRTQDDKAFQEYESLANYLEATKQTNALRQLFDSSEDDRALKDAADLSLTLAVLQALRDGRTNEIQDYFEGHLDHLVKRFASTYSRLPSAVQKETSLKLFRLARDYRAKFPPMNSNPRSDQDVSNAFKILETMN